MKKITLIGWFICGVLMYGFSADNATLKNKIQFASLEKAKTLITTPDEYTNGWSQFDIDSRLEKNKGTKEELLKYMSTQVKEWTQDEKDKLSTAVNDIDKIIADNGYKLNMPNEIFLVKSTMKDEGGADGYTRANFIVLNENAASMKPIELKKLIIHELFHVVTRYDSLFRKDIYKIFGFNMMNEVAYPDSIKNFKISNPDAPKKNSYISIRKDGVDVDCMMVLYSEEPYSNKGSFFDYLNIGLLKLKNIEGGKKGVDYVDKKPVLYSIMEVTGFFEQVGRNSPYIIDPEEIAAENFVYTLLDKTGLPSPWIIEKIKKRLTE